MTNNLPIYSHQDELIKIFKNNQIILITGSTGSGKSTQIPKILYNQNINLRLIISQPRRIAAIEMADRVQKEIEEIKVGYSVRFQNNYDKNTKIHFVTDGIILQYIINKCIYQNYDVIMIDEIHERTIFIDLIIFLLKKNLKKYPQIKLILASATLNEKKFIDYFKNDYKIGFLQINSKRKFLVKEIYLEIPSKENSILIEVAKKIVKIHLNEKKGDVLIFLPGSEECFISRKETENILQKLIIEKKEIPALQLHCLFGSQSVKEQKKVFKKVENEKTTRKVIFATNIAETSLTINNIGYVIDSGLVKQTIYNKNTKTIQLKTVLITKAQAIQRAGRAGRTQNGKCYRLYTKEIFNNIMSNDIIPEIKRAELRSFVLLLMKLKIKDFSSDKFIDSPDIYSVKIAIQQLFTVGIVKIKKNKDVEKKDLIKEKKEILLKEEKKDYKIERRILKGVFLMKKPKIKKEIKKKEILFKLTKIGKLVTKFPVDPLYGKILLLSKILGIENDICYYIGYISTTESLMSQNFELKKKFYEFKIQNKDLRGDFFCFLKLKEKHPNLFFKKALKNIIKIKIQLQKILKNIDYSYIKKVFKKDYAYKFYKKNKKLLKSNYNKFIITLITGLTIFSAKKQISNNIYKKLIHSHNCILDSESIYEMCEEFPKSIIAARTKGEGHYGFPVYINIFENPFPDICRKYQKIFNKLNLLDGNFIDIKKHIKKDKHHKNQAKAEKLRLAKEKFYKRKLLK